MAFGIDDAILLGGTALSALTSGGNSGKETREQFLERVRQFNEQMSLQKQMGQGNLALAQTGGIQDVLKNLESAPLRDKASYLLGARMGAVPGDFRPTDAFNPQLNQGPRSLGGVNAEAMQRSAANYHPGMGGIDPKVYEALLTNLGVNRSPGQTSISALGEPGPPSGPAAPTPPSPATPGAGGPPMPGNPGWGQQNNPSNGFANPILPGRTPIALPTRRTNPLGGGLVNPSGRSY